MVAHDFDQLRHRRQFILGPRPSEEFAHWRTTFVGPHLVLQAHEDLPLVEVEHQGIRLTLLGFVLDPLAPDDDDATILRNLAERCSDAHQAPRQAADLSGRWVMIADDGTDLILFHDPCGLREVYHTSWDYPETWCASQPHRIAHPLGLRVGAPQREFYESPYFRENQQAWMPGPTSPFSEIRHLLPNHFLDLRTREVRRYWPYRPLKTLELEEGAHLGAQLLREAVRAASRRFPLALPLTAGMDSRTVLAATRGLEDVWHYTGLWDRITRDSNEARTARRVSRLAKRRHHFIDCPPEPSADFAELYRVNTCCARDTQAAIAEGLLASYPQGRVHLSGHCSEIVRDTFGIIHQPDVSVEALSDLMGMRRTPFCLDQIDLWLEQVRPVCERTGYRAWDLFFMEQEYGVWAAAGQSQWDLVHDRFTPFNNRIILRTLMGVDPAHRQSPDYLAHTRMMELLWPDLLREPFNPSQRTVAVRSREIYDTLRRHGVRGTISKGMQRLLASS